MKSAPCIIVFMMLWIMPAVAAKSGASQTGTVGGNTPLVIDIDMAKFFQDSSHLYVELYYGIRENVITYRPDSVAWLGAAQLHLRILKDSTAIVDREWNVPHHLVDTAVLKNGKTMVGMENISLPFGDYRLTLVTRDMNNPTRLDSFSMPIRTKEFPTRDEALSDIELCSSIAPAADSSSMFYKNTLEVIPNASSLYGLGAPLLYYYAEGYNLTNPDHPADAIVRTTVTNAAGAEVYRQDRAKKRVHPSTVEYGKINVSGYRGGTYLLHISLIDSSDHIFAATAKKFFIYKPGTVDSAGVHGPVSSNDVGLSEYAVMSEKDIDQEFAYAHYIAAENEQKQYEKLKTVDAKRKFMFTFWQNRNPDASNPRNEVKIEYMKRVNAANEQFSRGFKEGWKTDRGRVYIVYGPFDEIDRSPSSSDSNPYEVWHYNSIQGGVIFVFVDRNGFGQYQLVHSTHRDELHDENWLRDYAMKVQ